MSAFPTRNCDVDIWGGREDKDHGTQERECEMPLTDDFVKCVFSRSKTGAGAFDVDVYADGHVECGTYGRPQVIYVSAQACYDEYRARHERTQDHAYWNVCYALESVLTPA